MLNLSCSLSCDTEDVKFEGIHCIKATTAGHNFKIPSTIVLNLTAHSFCNEPRMRRNELPTVAGYSAIKRHHAFLSIIQNTNKYFI